MIHGEHVHDCSCPPVEEWEESPYQIMHEPPGSNQKPGMFTGEEVAEWIVRNSLLILVVTIALVVLLLGDDFL